RTKTLLSQSGPGNSSSPGGGQTCSSRPKETPQKRQRQDDSVVDLTDALVPGGFWKSFPLQWLIRRNP
ncbi:hypothetical protein A2U01_0109910, partial [Trifolium medium]|nr:hypothetical protein [Trifolium medium]